jgi:nitric oxide reductase activation protein
VAEVVGKALLLPEDMKVWQEKRSKHMLENLKRDSILVSFETLYSNVSLYTLDELFIHMYIFHFTLVFISFFFFLGRSRYI